MCISFRYLFVRIALILGEAEEYFLKLPVILCVDTLVGGILLALLLPLAPERTRAKDTEEASLRRLTARLGGTAAPREPRLRHIFRAVTALLIILSGIYPTLCLAVSSRFGLADLNGDVIRAVIPVLAATAVALLLSVLCSYLCLASVKREAEACKRLLAMRAESPVAPVEGALGGSRRQPLSEEKKKTVTRIVQGVLLALAVALILLGVLNGGIDDVLGKAVRICTECIGLG